MGICPNGKHPEMYSGTVSTYFLKKTNGIENMVQKLLMAGFAGLIFLPLAGCGIKPDRLEPPPSQQEQEFPRTYPDPSGQR